MRSVSLVQAELAMLEDSDLVALATGGDHGAFRIIMQRNNQRLYRVARSVVRDDGEAEDVLQDAYLKAFGAIGEFRRDAALATWLTRIVLNEALGRVRKRRSTVELDSLLPSGGHSAPTVIPFPSASGLRPGLRLAICSNRASTGCPARSGSCS